MKGKKGSPQSQWIKKYLSEQGIDVSDWEEYQPYYNRYAARCKKYAPENYEQFLNLCTFRVQKKYVCGLKDPGDYEKELGGWGKKVNEPKEPREPKSPTIREPHFNEERYYKDQRKDFEAWKLRMKRYQDGKITNQAQQGETGKWKDFPPYMFKLAIRCLSGIYPLECYPEELNEYREELQNILNEQKPEKVWI